MAVVIDQSGVVPVLVTPKNDDSILKAVKGNISLDDVKDSKGRYAVSAVDFSHLSRVNLSTPQIASPSVVTFNGMPKQVTQVIHNNSGNGQLNVNPTGGVTSNLPHANQSTQTLQVISNNSGNGQLNVNPTGGVTSNLPHANQSNQTLQVIANVGGNGQLNVNPTGGVTSTLPYANHAPSVTTTIVNTPDGNGSYLGHGVVFQPHIHANQIGWGHFIGDTSGNYTGNLVDGLNLRFLHGAMSGPTQNTVAGTADGNGSYLQHGVVFNPHLTGGAVGWKNLLGDTSGDTTTNLIDAANKRFLHGAMSTGVQGVISSGAQLTVNPSGGVTGNLPQANHDPTVLLSSVTGNQRNLIPDSGLKNVKAYWTDHSGGLISVTQSFDGHTNIFTYIGTGSASGFLYQASKPITVNPGTYTLSAAGWVNNVTSGTMFIGVYNTAITTQYGELNLTSNSRASAQITIPSGVSQVVVIFDTSNATVANGAGSGVQNMQFEPGAVMTAYRENTGDNLSGTLLIDTGNSNHVGNWQHSYMSTSVRTTLASTAGGDGSYLNVGQVFNRHLNSASQSGLADDSTYLRWKVTQQTAIFSNPGANHITDPSFTSIADFWENINSATAGVLNQGTVAANAFTNNFNYDGRGNLVNVKLNAGDIITLQLTSTQAPTGTASTFMECEYFTSAGAHISYGGIAAVPATGTGTGKLTEVAPANCGYAHVFIKTEGNASGGNAALVTNPVVRINHETVIDVNAQKAYADFTDNAAGGHVGKTQSNIADDSNAKMLRFGTLAGRPAAGTAGRIYHASDAGTNGITYRDTGSAWVGMAVGHLADISGTLDNTNDGSSRFAVASVDPNKKALIDFSQPGHSNANIQYFGGIQSGTCYDGQAITFNPAYTSNPLVIFSGGGMSYSSVTGSATTQSQVFTASSLTTSGFTASLKLVSGGILTARTDTFTTVTSGSEYQATLTNAPAYNNTYTVNWVLSLNSSSEGTVYITETNSSGTILFQKTYLPGQNGAKSTPVIWSGATGTSVIDISLVLNAGSGTIGPTTVTFTSGTAPSSVSAVTSTAPITWVAFPQT